jgi:hypothetical protein
MRARAARARSGIFERKNIIFFNKNVPKGRRRTSVQTLQDSSRVTVETENLEIFSKLETKFFGLSNRDSTIAQIPPSSNKHLGRSRSALLKSLSPNNTINSIYCDGDKLLRYMMRYRGAGARVHRMAIDVGRHDLACI